MTYPKIPLAQTVIELCKAHDIQHIIISPGSRNAPLTIGFTNDPFFTCYSIVDERCAAFFAMGIAQQLQIPTAVVCTSGSALLNYYPAVAEAFYSTIPMVVLSADRPKHLIGIGDGQTIRQKHVYGQHSLYDANLKLDIRDQPLDANLEELPIIKSLSNTKERFLELQNGIQDYNTDAINTALATAKKEKGPVHINIPFDEPLYETTDTLTVAPKRVDFPEVQQSLSEVAVNEYVKVWNGASKKLILVGVHTPHSISKAWLDVLAKDDSVVVLTETTSNLHHDTFFPSIDQIISPLDTEAQKALQPDVLLTFGGLVVSKKIKALLREYKPKAHWHVDPIKANDTFFALTAHIKTTPELFFQSVLPQVTPVTTSSYRTDLTKIKAKRLERHDAYLEQIPFSDFKAFHRLLKALPKDTVLQVGNSSAIRYTQLFGVDKSLEVYCNRGTSGIDGSTSTAIGCAVTHTKQTTFITGDLSFLYDSNALWNNYIPSNFRILLVNNTGGGIFRILPGHKDTQNFDTYFETNHQLTAEHLCKMFSFEYQSVTTGEGLENALEGFFETSERPRLLEIATPKQINDKILLEYFKFIK